MTTRQQRTNRAGNSTTQKASRHSNSKPPYLQPCSPKLTLMETSKELNLQCNQWFWTVFLPHARREPPSLNWEGTDCQGCCCSVSSCSMRVCVCLYVCMYVRMLRYVRIHMSECMLPYINIDVLESWFGAHIKHLPQASSRPQRHQKMLLSAERSPLSDGSGSTTRRLRGHRATPKMS